MGSNAQITLSSAGKPVSFKNFPSSIEIKVGRRILFSTSPSNLVSIKRLCNQELKLMHAEKKATCIDVAGKMHSESIV